MLGSQPLLNVFFILFISGCAQMKGLLSPESQSLDQPMGLKSGEPKEPQDAHSVKMVDDVTFMIPSEKAKVWNALLDVLGKNYNILVLDEKSGVISTDWDSFYLEGQTLRNKVSVRVSQQDEGATKVLLANNEEVLKEKASNSGYIWLPSGEKKAEIKRIVKNTATLLGHIAPEM